MAAFGRRLTWARLRQAGLRLVSEEFKIVGRPLTFGFQDHPVGAPPPQMPPHKLRQLYEARRLDTVKALTTKDLLKHVGHPSHPSHAHRESASASVVIPVPTEVVIENMEIISVEVPAAPIAAPTVANPVKLSPAAQAAMRRPAPGVNLKKKTAR